MDARMAESRDERSVESMVVNLAVGTADWKAVTSIEMLDD